MRRAIGRGLYRLIEPAMAEAAQARLNARSDAWFARKFPELAAELRGEAPAAAWGDLPAMPAPTPWLGADVLRPAARHVPAALAPLLPENLPALDALADDDEAAFARRLAAEQPARSAEDTQ